ncbi:flagellin [Campylobacter sp. faydin G-24]|uniref:Flagellin n=1 Tax=Campylobacter anatolicus TaxID=2829105 RepID=A0ABS5HHV6_9BACT|nr:flagellin [Campylobacter anatolicus]MBR8463830.1 flagellin [Campylobacter anatolicus]
MIINGVSQSSHFDTTNKADEQKGVADKILDKISAKRALGGVDGSNLAIADALLSQSNELEQGVSNANDAIGMLQIADSTLSNLSLNADRINELNISLNNATLNDEQRSMIREEISYIAESMTKSIENATFNGKSIFGSELSFYTNSGISSINLNTNSITNVAPDGSNIDKISENITMLRSDIGSAQNGILSGINSSIERSIALKSSENNLQNNDIAENLNTLDQAILQMNATLIANVHTNSTLQTQISRLLA